ncbi:hypothetical protein BCR41DRAFT_139305 [Lobosporangium transversale]|uniref:Uncharacterized protein n=1 Tax=Lobosporangium transversale TaxID=64571 RepID=A0A1Y2GFN0_9FUNG|nr:hypothetical protein BCR41DRAFT_139305 [Lobosporangium transversale]ORZ09439.1 hypothetical protein BCR41DRAFT_139305 [Lobosporangium transversale]|eukprot:XP_021878892.1 hypothetical protein BCR41DRAFT_139305 [Lobosporangium transversale]
MLCSFLFFLTGVDQCLQRAIRRGVEAGVPLFIKRAPFFFFFCYFFLNPGVSYFTLLSQLPQLFFCLLYKTFPQRYIAHKHSTCTTTLNCSFFQQLIPPYPTHKQTHFPSI